VRTSRVTIFIVPPRNILFKVSDELVYVLEGVAAFLLPKVPVIALSNLVVVTNNATPD
jgi:hypothetical protein